MENTENNEIMKGAMTVLSLILFGAGFIGLFTESLVQAAICLAMMYAGTVIMNKIFK